MNTPILLFSHFGEVEASGVIDAMQYGSCSFCDTYREQGIL